MAEALNVKTALFFLAFLPQFVSPGETLLPQLVLLGSIRARLLTRVSGMTLLGPGAYLALARR